MTRGWIGVEPSDLSPELAQTFDIKDDRGVIITGVLQNGPAAQAGMRPGDVIVRISDKPVGDVVQLLAAVASLKPGAAAVFGISRKGEAQDLSVVPGLRPRPKPAAQP